MEKKVLELKELAKKCKENHELPDELLDSINGGRSIIDVFDDAFYNLLGAFGDMLKETLEKITVKEDKEKFINWVMLIFKPGGDREMDEQAPEITKILKKYFPNMKEINI